MKNTATFIVIAIFVALSCVCLASCAEKPPKILVTFDNGEMTYALYDNDEVLVVSYNGGETGSQVIKVTVPDKVVYEGVEYDVVGVQSLAFDHAKISQIELSDGITKVESYAFSYCSATILDLPKSLTSIGEYAFINMLSLRRFNIKAEVPPKIGKNAIKYYDNSLHEYRVSDILTITIPSDSYDSYYNVWRDYVEVMAR